MKGRPVTFRRDVIVSGRPGTLRTDDPVGALPFCAAVA
jgi:hypothetical protein